MRVPSLPIFFAVISAGVLAGAGCVPANRDYGYGQNNYCVCDADCPSGLACDLNTGACISSSSFGNHSGHATGGVSGA
ncbi:MAG TPA: hypothetical protein VHG72_01590, partial [Polyangia bacterium]|nr:hypothetical protein [Polyangia bacterium]